MSARKRINLMPREKKVASQLTHDSLLLWIAVPLLSLLLLDFTMGSRELSMQSKALEQITLSAQLLSKQMLALKISPNEQRQPNALTSISLGEILTNKVVWTEPLRELSRIVPSGVWLSKLQASYDKAGQRSLVINGSAGSESMVSDFYSRLEKSYHLRRVVMSFAERQKDAVPLLYNFEFKVPLNKVEVKTVSK